MESACRVVASHQWLILVRSCPFAPRARPDYRPAARFRSRRRGYVSPLVQAEDREDDTANHGPGSLPDNALLAQIESSMCQVAAGLLLRVVGCQGAVRMDGHDRGEPRRERRASF